MIIGYYNIANFITLTGMSSALCACYLAFMGHYKAAIVVYMLAGLICLTAELRVRPITVI